MHPSVSGDSSALLKPFQRGEDLPLLKLRQGLGWTFPNPMVGAVIVKRGKIIGRGYHQKAGLPHAEIEALRRARGAARDATLYVNIEPCCHYGKTPPCTDAIINGSSTQVSVVLSVPLSIRTHSSAGRGFPCSGGLE